VQVIPKAFVIAKVLYLRTHKSDYLVKLRKLYAAHNRCIKNEPPEYYQAEMLREPFEDSYFENK
jgi:hypothetical protein